MWQVVQAAEKRSRTAAQRWAGKCGQTEGNPCQKESWHDCGASKGTDAGLHHKGKRNQRGEEGTGTIS